MRFLDHFVGPQRSERPSALVAVTATALLVGGFQPSSTLVIQSTLSGSPVDDKIVIRAGLSIATPALVFTPVSGRLASVTTIDTYGNWFITAGNTTTFAIAPYNLLNPFAVAGQPASASDPDKPPGNVFNITANVDTTLHAFNVLNVNVYSSGASTHGHYAGNFTAYAGGSSSGAGGMSAIYFTDAAAAGGHAIVALCASSVVLTADVGCVLATVGQSGGTPRDVGYFFSMYSPAAPGAAMGLRVDGNTAITSTGTVIGLRTNTRINCAWGIDFLPNAGVTDATFSGGAFRSTGFSVGGTGTVTCQSAKITHATQSVMVLNDAAGTTKYLFGRSLGNDNAQNFFIYDNVAAAARLTLSSAGVWAFVVDRGVRFDNQTSAAAAATGTLTNAPAAGNPGHWLKINVGGTNYAIPCWAG